MAAPPEADTSRFLDLVNKVIDRVNDGDTQGSGADLNVPQSGPLLPSELTALSFLCNTTGAGRNSGAGDTEERQEGGFAAVPVSHMQRLVALLDEHVQAAAGVNFVESASKVLRGAESRSVAASTLKAWMGSGEGATQWHDVSLGLQAAAIVLTIVSTPGIDRRMANEDSIEVSITLARHHMREHLLPAVNETAGAAATPTSKKRRRSIDSSVLRTSHDFSKIYGCVMSSVPQSMLLLERMQIMVDTLPLSDKLVLMITSGMLAALEMDCSLVHGLHARQLQNVVVSILVSSFARYCRHRETMIEDLFPIMLRLPPGKRAMRGFPLRFSSGPATIFGLTQSVVSDILKIPSPTHIAVVSRLLLGYVQGAVGRPAIGDNVWVSGLDEGRSIADAWVDQLAARCAVKGDRAMEFRPHLTSFVEDMIVVFLLPEFPAAEYFLMSFVRRFTSDATQASPTYRHGKLGGPEAPYVTLAFDGLGKICALQARIRLLAKERPLAMRHDSDSSTAREDQLACYCNLTRKRDVFMVGCEQCNRYAHGRCVGVLDRTYQHDEWICDSCRLQRVADREASDKSPALVDDVYVLSHVFQVALAHRWGVVGLEDATRVHLAQWLSQMNEDVAEKVKGNPDLPNITRKATLHYMGYWDKPGPTGELLSQEGEARAILAKIAKSSSLMKSFRKHISFVLKLMGDESSPSLRKLSLKAIEKVRNFLYLVAHHSPCRVQTVEGDPSQMLLPVFTKALSSRLTDDTISVREAALSLAGSYVVRSPEVASAFHTALLPRLTDCGVSVRKRAVRIFESILTSNPAYKNRSSVFDVLLRRTVDPKEEDGVRDLIDRLFSRLWIENSNETVTSNTTTPDLASVGPTSSPRSASRAIFSNEADAGLVTPSPPLQKRLFVVQNRADISATQMVEVVRSSGSTEHLETLLCKFLIREEACEQSSVRSKRQENTERQCANIVKSLYELLFSIHEDFDDSEFSKGSTMAAILRTLSAFSSLAPTSVQARVDTLLCYLKADNGVARDEEPIVVAAVCEVMFRLPREVGVRLGAQLANTSTANDLKNVTFRFGPSTTGAAVRAFLFLSQPPDNTFSNKLLDLANTFYKFLFNRKNIADFTQQQEKVRSGVHRALTVLGAICQHQGTEHGAGEGANEFSQESFVVHPADLTWGTFMIACYRIFSSFLSKNDSATKCVALRALSGIFVSQPRLMLQLDHDGQIEDLMCDEAGTELQIEALNCWQSILKAEESRIDGGQASARMDANRNITLSKKISGDQDGDSTLFGGVLTSHSARLFALTKDSHKNVRYAALEVLGLLLRQGLVNPNEAVPHLFAMQGDIENDDIRSLGLQLLMTEGEKRQNIVRRRICDGVKRAFEFQRLVSPNLSRVRAIVPVGKRSYRCVFSRVFTSCVGNSRKQRHGFFKNLLGLFKPSSSSKPPTVELLSFIAQILAHLEYSSTDEPLFIVHEATSIVSLQGVAVLDKLTAVLRDVGLASEDACEDDYSIVDELERAAKSNLPGETEQAARLQSGKFDLAHFAMLVTECTALATLLRLKSFLRKAYNLSEVRCFEYDPNAERVVDKTALRFNISAPFDTAVTKIVDSETGDFDVGTIIRHYASFRSLFRADNTAQTVDDFEVEEDAAVDSPSKKQRVDV